MASRAEGPRTWPAALDHTGALLVLGMLVAADGFFVVLHLVNFYGPQPWERVNTVNNDWAHAEVFQYVKYLWAVGLLGAGVAGPPSGLAGVDPGVGFPGTLGHVPVP